MVEAPTPIKLNPGETQVTERVKTTAGTLDITRPVPVRPTLNGSFPAGLANEMAITRTMDIKPGWLDEVKPDEASITVTKPTLTPDASPNLLGRILSLLPDNARGVIAAGTVGLVAAACNPGTTPATPTTLPTNTPGATQTFEPSNSPAPSLEVTPPPASPTPSPVEATPTPEVTLAPISDVINKIVEKASKDGWKKVSKQDVLDSINTAYDSDPKAATLINPITNKLHKEIVTNGWDYCSTDTDTRHESQDCGQLEGYLYYGGFTADMNQVWISGPITNVIYYAHETLGPQDFNSFVAAASKQKSPF